MWNLGKFNASGTGHQAQGPSSREQGSSFNDWEGFSSGPTHDASSPLDTASLERTETESSLQSSPTANRPPAPKTSALPPARSTHSSEHAITQPETNPSVSIGAAHGALRALCHAFNSTAVFLSEQIFLAGPIRRTACVACTGFGWLISSDIYAEYPILGTVVMAGALSGAIAASSVNRTLSQNDLYRGEDSIAGPIKKMGYSRFRESLCVAGIVFGPASFWEAVSPVLRNAREFMTHSMPALNSASDYVNRIAPEVSGVPSYLAGRAEHLIPFVLIGILTTMKLVNQNPDRFVRSMSPTAGMLSPLFGWWAGLRESIRHEFQESSDQEYPIPEKLGLTHRTFRSFARGFTHSVLKATESIYTGHAVGRFACVACVTAGFLIPPAFYDQYPLQLGLLVSAFVAGGALSGSFAASAVNRALYYDQSLRSHESIIETQQRLGSGRFREGLSIAGMVAGPAAFWAAVSPLLERLRVGSGHAIQSIVQAPEAITIPIDYMTARLEHLIPFLLIGVLTTMRTVNHDPRGFLERMGPTAALLSTRFSWWAGLREWVGREFRDQPGDPKSEGAFEVQERRGKH